MVKIGDNSHNVPSLQANTVRLKMNCYFFLKIFPNSSSSMIINATSEG
jgi:hypothetical protein